MYRYEFMPTTCKVKPIAEMPNAPCESDEYEP